MATGEFNSDLLNESLEPESQGLSLFDGVNYSNHVDNNQPQDDEQQEYQTNSTQQILGTTAPDLNLEVKTGEGEFDDAPLANLVFEASHTHAEDEVGETSHESHEEPTNELHHEHTDELDTDHHHDELDTDHHHDEYLPPVQVSYINQAATSSVDLSLFDAELDLTETFALHSNVDASHTIYLDFDGHVTTHWGWTRLNNDQAIVTQAFDIDGDSSNFSDTELSRIQYIWQRVAEDFIPFDVNVTTADPGEEALRLSSNTDEEWGTRVVIGAGDWLGAAAGGVAYLSTFAYSEDLPAFVFPNYLGNGHEQATAEAISHEVGHTLGLEHDGHGENDYYLGHSVGNSGWAPIMGASYYQEVTQWSQGEYSGATSQEDDLAIITSQNGFDYRVDDHGNSFDDVTFIRRGRSGQTTNNSPSGDTTDQQSNPLAYIYQTGIIEQKYGC